MVALLLIPLEPRSTSQVHCPVGAALAFGSVQCLQDSVTAMPSNLKPSFLIKTPQAPVAGSSSGEFLSRPSCSQAVKQCTPVPPPPPLLLLLLLEAYPAALSKTTSTATLHKTISTIPRRLTLPTSRTNKPRDPPQSPRSIAAPPTPPRAPPSPTLLLTTNSMPVTTTLLQQTP